MMLITPKTIVFSHTKYRAFTHQTIVLSHTSGIVLSPTTPALKPAPMLAYKKRNYARASLTSLTFLTQKTKLQRGVAAPLHSLQEGKATKGMRASTHTLFF